MGPRLTTRSDQGVRSLKGFPIHYRYPRGDSSKRAIMFLLIFLLVAICLFASVSRGAQRSEFSGTYLGVTTFSLGIQREFFQALERLVTQGHVNEFFNVGVQELADTGVKVGFTSTAGSPWAEIDDTSDLAFAREHFFSKLSYAAAA